ncbi:MAG: hypothetical protein V2A73_02735 [Pseudomonadota bacterium]
MVRDEASELEACVAEATEEVEDVSEAAGIGSEAVSAWAVKDCRKLQRKGKLALSHVLRIPVSKATARVLEEAGSTDVVVVFTVAGARDGKIVGRKPTLIVTPAGSDEIVFMKSY